MLRSKLFVVLTVVLFIFGIAIVGLAQEQKAKTVKLPSGEEVVDISGEWDAQIEDYGPWKGWGDFSNILKITLEGNSFVGIRMKNDLYYSSGTEAIRGELDKNGIKNVQIPTNLGTLDAKGKISEDGKKIIIDDGEKCRYTLIRK